MVEKENSGSYYWGHSRRFNAYSNYISSLFGGRVQKVSVNAGFTCPNRDGTLGTGGCTFCNNDAFSPSYCKPSVPVQKQIEEGIKFHRFRYRRSVGYMAYFQSYTNTYGDIGRLRKVYQEALDYPEILGLIIGTRPDCVDSELLDYLSELAKKIYLIVEYGVESCYNSTLEHINRGHGFEKSAETIRETSKRGIKTGAHLIFGLPGESREEMLREAQIISTMPVDTLKLHQLQIIKGTTMEEEYIANPSDFELFSLDEYIEFIISFLERLRPSIIVERLTGEASPGLIAGPRWGMKRADQLMNMIEERLEEIDTWQGRLYNE